MELLVVRHAIAHERNVRRWPDDRHRPLTPEGVRKFRKVALGLKRLGIRPQRVLTSPLVRARQTADLLAQVAQWPAPMECAELSPEYAPADVIGLLRKFRVKTIAVVGHEPALGSLILTCVTGSTYREALTLKKGGLASVEFPRLPRAGGATLRWVYAPRILRAVAKRSGRG